MLLKSNGPVAHDARSYIKLFIICCMCMYHCLIYLQKCQPRSKSNDLHFYIPVDDLSVIFACICSPSRLKCISNLNLHFTPLTPGLEPRTSQVLHDPIRSRILELLDGMCCLKSKDLEPSGFASLDARRSILDDQHVGRIRRKSHIIAKF